MAVSEVSICNLALGWVGGGIIISLDDGTTEAKLCKANYESQRDAVLEAADWTFAQKRMTGGAPLASPPAWGYSHQFQLPADVLRVIYVGNSDRIEEDDPVDDWVREGRLILANAQALYIRAVQRVADPSMYSFLFVQALAARLAMDLAIPISHSRTLQADMARMYSSKLLEARAQDNKQGRMKVMRARGMQQARRAGTTGGTIGPTV